MAKKDSQTDQNFDSETGFAAENAVHGGNPTGQDLSSLKQVRDILVGPLSSELDQTVRQLDQRVDQSLTEFSDQTTNRVAEIEARFQGELDKLREQIQQLTDSFPARLAEEGVRLREELVDRGSLSAALSEVALRLSGPAGPMHDLGADHDGDIDIDNLLDG